MSFMASIMSCQHQVQYAIGSPPARFVSEPSRRLVLVHIPKTGGTAIQDFARIALHATVKSHSVKSSCNTTRIDKRRRPWAQAGAQSQEHCVNSYEASRRSPREETFCVVRRVLDRAVSIFNMRWGAFNRSCSAAALRHHLVEMLERGDIDNFDRPQHLFASTCERVLCFDHLEANLTVLFRHARLLNSSRYVLGPRNLLDVAGPAWFDAKRGVVALPHGKHAQRYSHHQCQPSDLDARTRGALLTRYRLDAQLLYERCGSREGAALPEAGAKYDDAQGWHRDSAGGLCEGWRCDEPLAHRINWPTRPDPHGEGGSLLRRS